MSDHTAKDNLRRNMRAALRAMDPAIHATASLVICQEAAHLPDFRSARCVALFSPLPSEPDVRTLIEEAWAEKKRVVLPRMIKNDERPELEWHAVSSWEELIRPGVAGLREPDPLRCPRVATAEIDCVFVPGLAFDERGTRLGRGGGYYDSFLSRLPERVPCIGLMFAQQLLPAIPHEKHDHPLRRVITEDGLLIF